MKLLRTYQCSGSAIYDAKDLAFHGILTHVTGKHSQDLSSTYTGALESGLYILLEDQFEDAEKFLHDKNHKITTGLSKKDFKAINTELRSRTNSSLNTAIAYGVILALVLLGVLIYISLL